VSARISLHLAKDAISVQSRKHKVEHDKIGLVCKYLIKPFPAVMTHPDLIARSLEIKRDQLGDIDIVFDD
jgi:hypothetical protein